jgi:hypothetical protein
MAITAIEYGLTTYLKQEGLLPAKPQVLELGEARWLGDLRVEQLANDIALIASEDRRGALLSELEKATRPELDARAVAKLFYSTFLDHCSLTTVDAFGSLDAIALDLNQPLALGGQFDLTLAFGTAEYVTNLSQFFKTTHEWTKPDGLMIHGATFTGWLSQGFFNFKPEFYRSLAARNGYQMLALVYAELYPLNLIDINSPEEFNDMVRDGKIADNALLYAVMKKGSVESEFQIPMRSVSLPF